MLVVPVSNTGFHQLVFRFDFTGGLFALFHLLDSLIVREEKDKKQSPTVQLNGFLVSLLRVPTGGIQLHDSRSPFPITAGLLRRPIELAGGHDKRHRSRWAKSGPPPGPWADQGRGSELKWAKWVDGRGKAKSRKDRCDFPARLHF